MAPLLLLLAGAVIAAAGFFLLASFGERFRIARLLQSTPAVSLTEAAELAAAATDDDAARYVRTRGRVDSDEAFLDEQRRPLVFRRTRLQVREPRLGFWPPRLRPGAPAWRTVGERRQRVTFSIVDGLTELLVRDEDLREGFVTVPKEAAGTAGEVADSLPLEVGPGLAPTTPVRLRVDQLSAVEHATVMGVPIREASGRVALAAGRDRPLVVTPLEDAEAMRLLASDAPRLPMAIAILLAGGLGLLAAGIAWLAIAAVTA